jgi:luciferase family oxidoreductase group 1
MSGTLRLGVLDTTDVKPGVDPRTALLGAVDLLAAAESLGYARYWLTQHYSHDTAQSTPEILLGVLAAMTERIRVGTAGILLHYDSPLRVANAFRLLETIYGRRIDLGIARGRVDDATGRALTGQSRPDLSLEAFGARFEALCRLVRQARSGPDEPVVCPAGSAAPALWSLGSAHASAALAARQGTSFSQSLFLDGSTGDPAVIRRYRDEYRPCPEAPAPEANLAVAGVCAETTERARQIAAEHHSTFIRPNVVGDPSRCAEELAALADRYQVDEVVYLDLATRPSDRLSAYALLAAELLPPAQARGEP